MDILKTPITYLKGVGEEKANLLKKELEIFVYEDLITTFPFRYIDRTKFYKTTEVSATVTEVQIIGKITNKRWVAQKRGKRLVATLSDDKGSVDLVWFKAGQWIYDAINIGAPYVVFGKVNIFNGRANIPHPELELAESFKKRKAIAFQAVYPSTEKLVKKSFTQQKHRSIVRALLKELSIPIPETLSAPLCDALNLLSRKEALTQVHFPENQALLSKALFRLKFEEFFFVQLELVLKNKIQKQKIKGHNFDIVGDNFNTFYNNYLPFDLTNAQKKVVKEIRRDIKSGSQMNRLLQGDVGSGKTVVAILSILIAIDNGFQATIVAPTEILAKQHEQSFQNLLKEMPINIALLTGSTKVAARRKIDEGLADGSLQILIGTHAVLEEKIQFKNLGMAIIDEQHRFGVAQRAALWKKNNPPPHILVMTATPIPRTLAMNLYGDLDISVIDELPPGRKEIITKHFRDSHRLKVFHFIKEEIANGRQVYIVYPLIAESEKMDYKDLMDGYESVVRSFPMPQYQVSIVHGQMKHQEKEYEMQRFVKGETQIMVATTVIEVGVNVPNASVMIIESAERFGLSQLHQLRGRVGRGNEQSFCVLMSGNKLSNEAKKRLQTMVETNDGFKIAETDLLLRGPGDLMGTKQSGIMDFKIANIVQDGDILEQARYFAQKIVADDPTLQKPENSNISLAYQKATKGKELWKHIS